jgi:hypothetical protein
MTTFVFVDSDSKRRESVRTIVVHAKSIEDAWVRLARVLSEVAGMKLSVSYAQDSFELADIMGEG